MGSYGGYYKGDKKKPKKERLEKEALKIKKIYSAPKVEIFSKGKVK